MIVGTLLFYMREKWDPDKLFLTQRYIKKEKYCVIWYNSSIPLLFVLVVDDDDVLVLVLVIFIIFGKEKKYLSKNHVHIDFGDIYRQEVGGL